MSDILVQTPRQRLLERIFESSSRYDLMLRRELPTVYITGALSATQISHIQQISDRFRNSYFFLMIFPDATVANDHG